jgi:3-oxoacyl-[acyl-carrier-protein] synthase II
MDRKVVITGMGTVNPLGKTVDETWANMLDGVSGVGPITSFDASDLSVRIACEIKDFEPSDYMPEKDARRIDRYQQFGVVAANQAIAQSGLEIGAGDPGRVGIIVSTAVGGLSTLEEGLTAIIQQGPNRVSPFFIPRFMPNGASGLIAIEHGATGPCYSLASACASGVDSIGLGWRLIQAGLIEACIAGGAEATVARVGIAPFVRMGALSKRNDEMDRTPSPFDLHRDGLVMGEGAAVLVIESMEHARKRGAAILGEVAGHASTVDAFHITAPSESGAGGAAAMVQAMQAAGVNRDEIGYVNAHGTGTELNDISETRAIKTALGERAYATPVSATKSMTGHMMGATGALEAIVCVLAIRDKAIPPTTKLVEPDPECDLDYVPNEARQAEVKVALDNAFGFGGHNAVLVLREFSD